MQVHGSIAGPCSLLLTPAMLSLADFGRSCIVEASCSCCLCGSVLLRQAFGDHRAAHCSALLLLSGPLPSAMATEDDMEVTWPGSPEVHDSAGLCCSNCRHDV